MCLNRVQVYVERSGIPKQLNIFFFFFFYGPVGISSGCTAALPRCQTRPPGSRDQVGKNILIAPVTRGGATHQVAREGRPSATQRATYRWRHPVIQLFSIQSVTRRHRRSGHFAMELDIKAFIFEVEQRPAIWDVAQVNIRTGKRRRTRGKS